MERLRIKVGAVLIGGFVWGSGLILAAQHVQAHTTNLTNPSCNGLPADAFLTAAPDATTNINSGGPVDAVDIDPAKQGTDLTNEGDRDFYYAKITVPALTAGELRVFDRGDGPSDAVLCHGSSSRATSRSTYTHHDQSRAATDATNDATTAREASTAAEQAVADANAAPRTTDTEIDAARSTASTALTTARGKLSSTASDLDAAARALRNTANNALTETAKNTALAASRWVELAAQMARTKHATHTGTPTQSSPTAAERLTAVTDALTGVADALSGTARSGADDTDLTNDVPGSADEELTEAAGVLTAAAGIGHLGFQIRADVQPGDRSYILVASANAPPTLAVAFHGAISSSGSLSGAFDAGKSDSTIITVTAPGLLTLETTGTTDTMGALDGSDNAEVAHADSGGSGGNFKMYAPVTTETLNTDENYTLYVEGQTDTIGGDYDLKMDFQVAMGQIASLSDGEGMIAEGPDWGDTTIGTALPDDNFASPAIQDRSDTDYFVFTIAANNAGLLTVHAEDGTTSPASDTTGTLYGPPGVEIASATDGSGRHFRVRAPVQAMNIYAVEVSGTVGSYAPMVTLDAVEEIAGAAGALLPVTGSTSEAADGNCATEADNDAFEICPPTSDRDPAEREYHLLEVTEAGTLYIHSTGGTDTIGTLFGPDGSQLDTDDNSSGNNFRLAVQVTPGLYLLEVRGKDANTRGAYELVTNFVAGAGPDPEPPTEPTTPTEPDPEPVTDATGFLGNPPHNSTRSGIGIISGWVCEASNVTITITPVGQGGSPAQTFNIGYGADRPDTVGRCDHRSPDTGFGMAYNFNRLIEGQYRITARADEQQIGASRLFTVIYLDPDDTFLEDLEREVEVTDFPATGETTTLEWEESLQNFEITDVQ